MKYRFFRWCDDCYLNDSHGCLGGSYDSSEREFDSVAEAEDAALSDFENMWSFVVLPSAVTEPEIREAIRLKL